MLGRLILSLGAYFLISVSIAQACSPVPLTNHENGRTYYLYDGVTLPEIQNLKDENRFIAIVETRLIEHHPSPYVGFTTNRLRHELVKTLHGNKLSLPDRNYIDISQDTSNKIDKKNSLDFQFWETLKITSTRTDLASFPTDCGSVNSQQLVLEPKSLYLTFGHIWDDGSMYISDAVKLKSKRDPIVKAFRKFIKDEASAPNKMNAETYFKNISAFAEVSIHECPSNEYFRYEDSQYTKTEDQINALFSVKDSYDVKDSDLNIQDFSYYLNIINKRMMPDSFTSITCEYEEILVLKSRYDKYLPIVDGRILSLIHI